MRRKMKTSKQMERHFKGIANHRRIDILLLVKNHDGIALEDIAETLNCNFKTISEHTRRLVAAGLLNKRYKGRTVLHSLSPYGQKLVTFIKTFQYS
jgi:DNA-binding MarR family transcriptional regulator